MNFKWRECEGGVRWIKIGHGGGLLWTRQLIFGSHKRRETSWPTEIPSYFQGLCSVESVSMLVSVLFLKATGSVPLTHRKPTDNSVCTSHWKFNASVVLTREVHTNCGCFSKRFSGKCSVSYKLVYQILLRYIIVQLRLKYCTNS
jgi:hypothetical protein